MTHGKKKKKSKKRSGYHKHFCVCAAGLSPSSCGRGYSSIRDNTHAQAGHGVDSDLRDG